MFRIPKDKQSVLKRAVDTYGAGPQLGMLMEECAELIQAANKVIRNDGSPESLNCLFEEAADAFIMLGQMEIMFKCTVPVNKIISSKLERLEKHLERK